MKLLLIIGIPVAIVVLIIIIALLTPSFDERRKGKSDIKNPPAMPKINFKPKKLINILVILVIAGGVWWVMKNHPFDVPGSKITAVIHEYHLSAGERIDTKLNTSQGTSLRFWASKPFYVVNVVGGKPDTTTGEYRMPSGESFCRIGDPSGPFVIRGEFDETVVNISEVR